MNSVKSGIFITYELMYILDNHSFLSHLFFLSERRRFSSERKLILFRKKIKFLSDVFTLFFRKKMQFLTKKGRIYQTEDSQQDGFFREKVLLTILFFQSFFTTFAFKDRIYTIYEK